MAFNVAEFRANMIGDGARPNLFQVTLTFPTFAQNGSAAGAKTTFMAKAAQLPGSTIGTVSMNYFGREVKFAGNRSFQQWSLTIINDEDFSVRNAFERWMSGLNAHVHNLRLPSLMSSADYQQEAFITQYGKSGDVLKVYKMVGCFPTDLSAIDVDWGADNIEDFTVTFAYQWWESVFPIPTTDFV